MRGYTCLRFQKNNDAGARYIFTEHIKNDMEDWPLWGKLDDFDEAAKSEINRQFKHGF